MATPKEGTKGQHETRRVLKGTATNSAGGSTKYATKRTLKKRQSITDHQST
jgi:hypothetical protein